MIKLLEYKQIVVDKALVIEIPKGTEVIVRKKGTGRNIFKVIKDILKVDIRDSEYKDIAMNQIHNRITFK